jgi:asparagine synthase (glutamine-hydrolysing)
MQGVLNVGDKLSMAHTIEMRVPFLDNELVDYVLTLPRSYLVGKVLLKDAFSAELHPSILHGKKRGFSSPDWIDGEGNQALKWARAALTEWRNIFKPEN